MSKRQVWVVECDSTKGRLFIFDMCTTEESANAQRGIAARRNPKSQYRVVRYVPAEESSK